MVQKQLQRDVCTKETSDHVLQIVTEDEDALLQVLIMFNEACIELSGKGNKQNI